MYREFQTSEPASQSDRSQQTVAKLPTGIPRFFEVMLALVGLIICAPVFAIAALAVALTSRGPIIYRHKRVGLHGQGFDLYKFRTMLVATDGLQLTARDDSRVTPIGKFLRRSKLDELPGLWNVLKGDLALVGARPEAERYVDPASPIWQLILQARPGITDPVTLRLRNEEALLSSVNGNREKFYVECIQPYKLKGYLEYLQKRNWTSDISVLWQTAVAIVLPATALPPTADEIGVSSTVLDMFNEDGSGEDVKKRPLRRLLSKHQQYVFDIGVLCTAFVVSYLLRFDFEIPDSEVTPLLLQTTYIVPLQFLALMMTGVYSFIWVYVGMSEVKTFVKAALYSLVPVVLLRLLLSEEWQGLRAPLSVIVMDTGMAFGGVLAVRVMRRALYERYEKRHRAQFNHSNGQAKPVLLIGAGRAGMLTAKEIQNRGDLALDIKGFVDDDPQKQGSLINRIRVLGTTQDIPRLVREMNIDHVVVTIADASRSDFRRILNICRKVPIKARTIPGLYEILRGNVKVSRIRDIQIEDLLGRDPVSLDESSMKAFLAGKSVMVTGAGGSIGSELSRQIARFEPAEVLLVERAEGPLFYIERELREQWPNVAVVALVGDVGDEARMKGIFTRYSPHVVLHAAAHKHVPMMESNVTEAVKNNVLATRLLGELAGQFGVESFVLISTDKAVRPTSVMGATKRVAELVVQNLNDRFETRYLAVRFGNVIGSAGSVIPLFREQINRGGPVTVTHPEMVRYFMTIPEAAQLVLQAGAMGKGSEIFILDMGEPVRILDLAKDTITLSGLKPYSDIDIVFCGIRPGEKLYEELDTKDEKVAKTRHPKIFIGQIAAPSKEQVSEALKWMRYFADSGQEQQLRLALNQLLIDARIEAKDIDKQDGVDLSQPILAASL